MTGMRRRKGGMDVGGRKREKRSRSTALKSSADDKKITDTTGSEHKGACDEIPRESRGGFRQAQNKLNKIICNKVSLIHLP